MMKHMTKQEKRDKRDKRDKSNSWRHEKLGAKAKRQKKNI